MDPLVLAVLALLIATASANDLSATTTNWLSYSVSYASWSVPGTSTAVNQPAVYPPTMNQYATKWSPGAREMFAMCPVLSPESSSSSSNGSSSSAGLMLFGGWGFGSGTGFSGMPLSVYEEQNEQIKSITIISFRIHE